MNSRWYERVYNPQKCKILSFYQFAKVLSLERFSLYSILLLSYLQKFPGNISGSSFVSKGCTVADITSSRLSGVIENIFFIGCNIEYVSSVCDFLGVVEVEAVAVSAW